MESTWVRSIYLYAMCAVALLLMATGAVTTVVATGSIISPSLGHRDTLDRVGIGIVDVAQEVVDVITEQSPDQQREIRDFCEDFYPPDEVESCIDDQDPAQQLGPVMDGMAKVKDELETQIRNSALAKLIRGLALLVVGWLLWRFHAHRTDLYRDGIRRPKPAPSSSSPTVAPPVEPPPPSLEASPQPESPESPD